MSSLRNGSATRTFNASGLPPMRATAPARAWKGPWLLAVAALHTVFALLVFGPVIQEVLERGVFNTVGRDARVGVAVWFVLFGFGIALLGLAVQVLERTAPQANVRAIGAGLLLLTLLGVTLMPASGFWLVLPVALAMLRKPTPS